MGILSPNRLRVAVLRGGPSPEYDVSLRTGANVLSILREQPEKYDPLDIFISKEGKWHEGGLAREPHHALRHVDVVFNALHGVYGEDGGVQKILHPLNIPFTGPKKMSALIAFNKDMSKRTYQSLGLDTPHYEVLDEGASEEELIYIFRTFLHPVVIKPATGGSSFGISLAHSFQELKDAVKHALGFSKRVVVEEFIRGKEATCGVIENFRGERFYAPLPVEIKKTNHLFDYDAKYSGKTEELCPGSFTTEENKIIESMAKRAHEGLGLSHYSRSDFIVTPKKIYILETNALPGLTKESLLPKSLAAVGLSHKDFIDHVINLALE